MLSRKAKTPLLIPAQVEVNINGNQVKVIGPLGTLERTFNDKVTITKQDNTLILAVTEASKLAKALSGTVKALLTNMVTGVTQGFEKRLTIFGVGYKAQAQGKDLHLTLGFSHPIVYKTPNNIEITTPTATEIVVKGIEKELVGQVAALIRSYRPVEPYKGKGLKYINEVVILKETKKK